MRDHTISILHVRVQPGDDGWYVAQGLEEPAVITQARSLDALITNVRDAYGALTDSGAVQIELLIPSSLKIVNGSTRRPTARRRSGQAA